MLRGLIDWVLGEIGPDVPVHFTRFHPDYQLRNLPPTPVATLERAREMAMGRGMHYAYVGNVPDHPGNHTYCPSCGKAVIRRTGFFIVEMHVNERPLRLLPRKDRRRLELIRKESSHEIHAIRYSVRRPQPGGRRRPARRERTGGEIRPPVVAGKFYPESATVLKLAIEKFMEDAAAGAGEKAAGHRRPPCRLHLLRPDLRRRLQPGPRRGL